VPVPEPFVLGGVAVAPGTRATVRLPLAAEYTLDETTMPVHVVHGADDGPRLFVSAAIHGDELVGVEVVRRLLGLAGLRRLRGTLVAVPVVNVYGYEARSRYLPDRRDLNRSFPGSARGSMAARLAHLFLTEVAARCTHGVDLHTAAVHRTNLPHVRTDATDAPSRALADAFGGPYLLHADSPDGSMRAAARALGVPVLIYEAGEALRLGAAAVRAGVRGLLGVMTHLGMLPPAAPSPPPRVVWDSGWTRAPASGTVLLRAGLGATVEAGETVGWLTGPAERRAQPIVAAHSGVVIGHATLPLAYAGEAIVHVARTDVAGPAGGGAAPSEMPDEAPAAG